jgi:hypothetical protein
MGDLDVRLQAVRLLHRTLIIATCLAGCRTVSIDPTTAASDFVSGHLEANWVAMSDAEKMAYCSRCPGCCSGERRQRELVEVKARTASEVPGKERSMGSRD